MCTFRFRGLVLGSPLIDFCIYSRVKRADSGESQDGKRHSPSLGASLVWGTDWSTFSARFEMRSTAHRTIARW